MKHISEIKIVFRLSLGVAFLLTACFAQADVETGYFQVWAVGSADGNANYFYLQNKTVPAAGTGTGRCGYGLIATPLNSNGNQAAYSMALAAVMAGKQISVNYIYNTSLLVSCTVDNININQ